MLPQLSNTELLLLLLTLWLLWFYGDILWQMPWEMPEEARKKKRDGYNRRHRTIVNCAGWGSIS